jgi:hypothetical protein
LVVTPLSNLLKLIGIDANLEEKFLKNEIVDL